MSQLNWNKLKQETEKQFKQKINNSHIINKRTKKINQQINSINCTFLLSMTWSRETQ